MQNIIIKFFYGFILFVVCENKIEDMGEFFLFLYNLIQKCTVTSFHFHNYTFPYK